jgi:Fic family protein
MKLPDKPPTTNGLEDLLSDTRRKEFFAVFQDTESYQKLNEIDKEYPYWERFKYKVRGIKHDPELLWAAVKLSRLKGLLFIQVSSLPGFKFKYTTTQSILKLLHHFDMNLGGVLEGRSIIPSEDKTRYLISSIMEEAIASSQLEGAATTRQIAKEMLRSNRKPQNHSEKMILNNYLTIKKVIERKGEKLCKELVLDLHKTISSGTLKNPENEGKFRTSNNVNVVDDVTGDIFYQPPNAEHIEKLMNDFCEFANAIDKDLEFIHPIIRGIILHFLIGYIHPFVDGNGRTARAIFYWYLIKKGYWLVEYMSISKVIIRAPAQYARAYLYTEFDENDLTYFIDYNLKCMDIALKNLQSYIERKVMEKKNLIHLIQYENINERQAEILRSLIVDNQQRFTIAEVEGRFGVVYQTARTDLYGLANLGYLKERKYGKKLIFFKSEEFDKKLESIMKN